MVLIFLQHHLLVIETFGYLTILLLPLLLLMLYKKHVMKQPRLNLPPGPSALPLIGNLHQLGTLPPYSFWLLSKKHGPLMYLRLGRRPTLVVSSAEMAKAVMKTHDLSFCTRPSIIAPTKLSYGRTDVAFAPYSDQWKQSRKICMLHLLSTKRVEASFPVREEEVQFLVTTISNSSSSVPVNLTEMLICLLNDITCREIFGKKFSAVGDYKSKFHEMVLEAVALLGGFSLGDFFPSMEWLNVLTGVKARHEKIFLNMDNLLEEIIESSSNDLQLHQNDFLTILLKLQKESTLGIPISKDAIKATLMNLFLAGTETTAATIEWGMAELMKNPRVMKKAQDEIWGVIGKKGRVEESDIHKLGYLKLIVREIFRLHPSVPLLVPRECREECKINDYDIPTGTVVYVNVWAIGRDPILWENPDEFYPERFNDSPIDYKGQSFELLPFGSGRRACPGITFGVATVELALANILHNFYWDLPPGIKKEEIDMSETFGAVARKKYPLFLLATPRN